MSREMERESDDRKNKGKRRKEASDFELSDSSENPSSYENSECVKKEKKIKLKLKKQRIYKKKNHGSWSPDEERRFVEYMKLKREIFEDKDLRRSHRIFRQMSKALVTRSSEQCRSHHQKYQIKFETFDFIVRYIEAKISQDENQRESNSLRNLQSDNSLQKNPPLPNLQRVLKAPNDHFQEHKNKQLHRNMEQDAWAKNKKEEIGTKAESSFKCIDLIQRGVEIFLKKCRKNMEINIQVNLDQFFNIDELASKTE